MIKYFIIWFLIVAVSCSIDRNFILENFKNKSTKELFKVYHYLFEKTYELYSDEGVSRYRIFKQNLKWIKERNSEIGDEVFGITQFTDLTNEEFKQRHLMDPVALQKLISREENKKTSDITYENKYQTSYVDWTPKMQIIKDQENCKSSWAFAVNAAIEGNFNILTNQLLFLSEQYLIDCDDQDSACERGWPTTTLEWVKKNGLLDGNIHFYKAKKSSCDFSDYPSPTLNIASSFESCESCSPEQWRSLLAKGPLVVAMDASDLRFYIPKNGSPWVPKSCKDVNHIVVAVGMESIDGVDHLIVRNSWGSRWGNKGYFKVAINNHCGIMKYAWLPITQTHKPLPPTNCATFSSSCDPTDATKSEVCYGVNDLTNILGGKNAAAFSLRYFSPYTWHFFTLPNCSGNEITVRQQNICFAQDPLFRLYPFIASAANDFIETPPNCFWYFTKPCFEGERTLFCGRVSYLSNGFNFSKDGSIYFPYSSFTSIRVVIFYSETNYQGWSQIYYVKEKTSKVFNMSNNPKLSFLYSVKSLIIS